MDGRVKVSCPPACPCTGKVLELVLGSPGSVWAHVVYDDDDKEDLYLRDVLALVADGEAKANLVKSVARLEDIK